MGWVLLLKFRCPKFDRMVVTMKSILIIEDDIAIAELQKDYLLMSGYKADIATDGREGLSKALTFDFDLIILDLMLPGMDGFSVLKQIEEKKRVPVLIVSAHSEEMYKIKGLNLGADDYITKPFSTGELVARVNSHIKKYEKLQGDFEPKSKLLCIRDLTIDETDMRVFTGEAEITLKQKEFELLLFLAKNPNRVYNKEMLFERVWGFDALSDASTVTVHIARIREKIETDLKNPQYIETVWGAGYRFRY